MAHTCNPSYSGGRNQNNCGSTPAPQIVRKTLSQKHPSQKRTGRVAQAVRLYESFVSEIIIMWRQ
jgi:hypothetical protein